MGDASDNIPDVPGAGAVTAKKPIAQFGSLEKMPSNTASIKGKMREKPDQNADNAHLSYELAKKICGKEPAAPPIGELFATAEAAAAPAATPW